MPAPMQAPARLGRYELIARLATGGMGEIFLARLEGAAGFEKLYVVKRILPHLADDARFREMLIAEARIASLLSHPNICQVYELGETDGQLFIVMEYLEGVTLLPILRRASKEATPLEAGFIAGVVQQVADALHYAHELHDRNGESMGIVHRDVTPSNIFATVSGVVKLLDFGIAKVKDATAHTKTGTVKGKYAYMAPEQLRGGAVDRRADVFGLGVVIYEMLALRRLFQRKTDYLTFRAVMEQPITDVRRYRPDVPEQAAAAVARALERDPHHRFESARQLGTAFVDALGVRPWSNNDLADHVRARFAAELGLRSAQIATVVRQPSEPTIGRSTMPQLATEPAPPPDDLDDDEFPAVDTAPSVEPGRPGNTTLPPFGAEPSAPQLQIFQPLGEPARRSLVWPVLAIAMVGIAAAALVLVWKQAQVQQPMDVKIYAEPSDRAQVHDAPAAVPDVAAEPKPPAREPDPPVRPKPPRRDPYTEAIRAQRGAVNRCAQLHGAPPKGARVEIVLTTAGKPKRVQLVPANLDSTPLGGCIRNVFQAVMFPSANDERKVDFTLTVN